jgi:ferredoxin
MTFVVTEACIRCKYTDCVAVCPVEAFHEGETMLVINPDECIDCAACLPECPAEAILPDTEPEAERWLELNTINAKRWPVIAAKKAPLTGADEMKGVEGKLKKYFSADPVEGD